MERLQSWQEKKKMLINYYHGNLIRENTFFLRFLLSFTSPKIQVSPSDAHSHNINFDWAKRKLSARGSWSLSSLLCDSTISRMFFSFLLCVESFFMLHIRWLILMVKRDGEWRLPVICFYSSRRAWHTRNKQNCRQTMDSPSPSRCYASSILLCDNKKQQNFSV